MQNEFDPVGATVVAALALGSCAGLKYIISRCIREELNPEKRYHQYVYARGVVTGGIFGGAIALIVNTASILMWRMDFTYLAMGVAFFSFWAVMGCAPSEDTERTLRDKIKQQYLK